MILTRIELLPPTILVDLPGKLPKVDEIAHLQKACHQKWSALRCLGDQKEAGTLKNKMPVPYERV